MNITNYDDVIDSRDVIERIEELENQIDVTMEEANELISLKELAEEGSQYSDDWQYGSQLIRESYFEEYMDDMVADCYELPKDMPWWMSIKLDYDTLKQDYTEIEFDGVTYYIR